MKTSILSMPPTLVRQLIGTEVCYDLGSVLLLPILDFLEQLTSHLK